MTFKELRSLIQGKIIEDLYKVMKDEAWNKAVDDYIRKSIEFGEEIRREINGKVY